MKTYFAISDIHGSNISYQDFIDKGFEPGNENHYIILCGDYFDRRKGHMYDIVQFIDFLKETFPTRAHIIIGNHDKMFLDLIRSIDELSTEDHIHYDDVHHERFYRNGGKTTMRELIGGITINSRYTRAKKGRINRYISLIESFEDFYETDTYIFTHAFINKERETDVWNREMIYSVNETGKTVIIGHATFGYLDERIAIKENTFAYNTILDNKVYIIDDGSGKNITVWEETV